MMEREIRLLEFHKIRSILADGTITPMGRELAEDVTPTADLSLALRWQRETSEAVSLLTRHAVNLEVIPDLRRPLGLACRGSMLPEEQLLGVLKLLNAATRLKTYFKEKEGFPVLSGLAEEMAVLPQLREDLRNTIDDDGRLRDTASPELHRLRRAIITGERDLRERFDKFIRNTSNQKMLQESLITVRGDRLVVPIRQEYRNQVPGVVHDQSASGATLFIEPLWALETNNKLAEYRRDAERERDRILTRLSQWVGAEEEALRLTLTLYAELDFILAKGRLSLGQKGVEPRLNDVGYINLIAGRHPLLTGDVVPISLEMGESLRTLVITGPNTGGKTVTLKTVGLFALMAQSGLHVPASEGTTVSVFPRIFADIGDEQNIEQSLSTFSGHLKNIINIIADLVPGALVLLDEVGAGTDPTEGAGLAMSILETLHDAGAVTVATTHYSQLKAFAYITEGMENASVEFDVATLRPTYQLLVGVPGLSNAFAIASRLGLPEHVITRGKEFLSHEETRLEEVVADLVADRRRLELVSQLAETERKETQTILAQTRRERETLENRREEILDKARTEAQELVNRAKRESQQLLKQLRKMAAQQVAPDEEQIQLASETLKQLGEDVDDALPRAPRPRLSPDALVPGREVYVNSLGQKGIVAQADGKTAYVLVGSMRITVDVTDLSPAGPSKEKAKPAITGLALFARYDVSRELDLRGLTLDEAIVKTDAYLDDAAVADLKEVLLIHGKGTGRLRTGLRAHLHNHPRVTATRTGTPAEGGTGAMVVTLQS
jgi:DNA mismatch repair protein MutS2